MPEPNLPPLIVYEDNASLPTGTDACQVVVLQKIKEELPELPSVKRDRLVQTHGILPEHSFTLVVSFWVGRQVGEMVVPVFPLKAIQSDLWAVACWTLTGCDCILMISAGLSWFGPNWKFVTWSLVFMSLQNEDGLMDYFEAVLKVTKKEPRKVIGWVTNELLGHLRQQDMSVCQRWDAGQFTSTLISEMCLKSKKNSGRDLGSHGQRGGCSG